MPAACSAKVVETLKVLFELHCREDEAILPDPMIRLCHHSIAY
jgi:hypothetical protein